MTYQDEVKVPDHIPDSIGLIKKLNSSLYHYGPHEWGVPTFSDIVPCNKLVRVEGFQEILRRCHAEITVTWRCKNCDSTKTAHLRYLGSKKKQWQGQGGTQLTIQSEDTCLLASRAYYKAEREKAFKNRLEIIDQIYLETHLNLQISRNLKIIRSPITPARSVRYGLAVFRIIELGISPSSLVKFCHKRVDPLMIWYKIKKALCLTDSSCGLRSFFM